MSPRSGASSALSNNANANQNPTVNNYSQGDGPRSSQDRGPRFPKRSPTCISLSHLAPRASNLPPRAKRARTATADDSGAGAASSAVKEQDSDEPVRALWAVAFPSLPRLAVPTAVSAASLTDSLAALTPSSSSSSSYPPSSPGCRALAGEVGAEGALAASPSYGWFVFTDADGGDGGGAPSDSAFVPSAPDLPNRILEVDVAPPGGGHQGDQGKTFLPAATQAPPGVPLAFEVASDQQLAEQQALAADTVDDVLGDLF